MKPSIACAHCLAPIATDLEFHKDPETAINTVQISEEPYDTKSSVIPGTCFISRHNDGLVVVSEESIPGAKFTNMGKGCCKYDYFDVVCAECGTVVGAGENDCWNEDNVRLDKSKVILACTVGDPEDIIGSKT